MTISNVQSGWNVGRTTGTCAGCGQVLGPATECWAALCDRPAVMGVVESQGAAESKALKDAAKDAVVVSPFVRLDFCETCWESGKRPENSGREGNGAGIAGTMFSFWKTVVPTPQAKKKLLVDDAVLVDVFQRMEGKSEPQEIRFRFVLALILMRKRLLKYEGMEEKGAGEGGEAAEIWQMTPRGQEASVTVINPHLTGEQISEVSQQLSAILAEEI